MNEKNYIARLKAYKCMPNLSNLPRLAQNQTKSNPITDKSIH